MTPETRAALLKDEYLLLQRFYEDFDARAITIKGWSATIGIAAIGGGFYQSKYLWLFAACAAAVFWLLEALWKSFQYLYGARIQRIEAAFRDDDLLTIAPFQIYTSWFEQLHRHGLGVARNAFLGVVLFPHAFTLVAGVALFLAEAQGWMILPRK